MSDFWDVIVWMFWFQLLVAWIILFFHVIGDVFTDSDLSGGAKALWTLLLLWVPWIGPLIYLAVRGRSMSERSAARPSRGIEATSRSYV